MCHADRDSTFEKSLEMKRILVVVSLCLIGSVSWARSISLDLTGSSNGVKRAAYLLSSSETEEIRSHRLEAGAAKVSGLEVGDVITFKLFADKTLAVTLTEETSSLSGRAFLGRIENALDAIGCVVLETNEGIVLDVTDFENQRVWQVVSDANGVVVREIKPDDSKRQGGESLYRLSGQHPVNVSVTATNGVTTVVTNAATVVNAPVSVANAVSSETAAMPLALATSSAATSDSGGDVTVDILVNYDTDAAAWARTNGGGIETFAETCVQKMNAALANTGLDTYFRFRLVGVYEVGGSAGGDITYALQFADGTYSGTLNGVSWAGVAAERDRLSADIVCTLCDNGSAYGTVGLGYALMSGSDSANCGFNACLIRAVANGHTMTHEVGHNMGAGHSDAMADADNCGPQYYDYSSGYYFNVGSAKYHTIMAYNADGYGNYYTGVPYFSSPDHFYSGVAVGTAYHDNTRTLNMNYRMVAGNRMPPYADEEIGQGFEAENYTWTTDGSYPWVRVTDNSYDGDDSSRSCEMSGWSTSWTETKVQGPAVLKFMLCLRSYKGWFNVLTDSAVSYTLGGETETFYGSSWELVSVEIPSGVHTVRLAYTHNGGYFTSGGNGAWVDQLKFEGGTPVVEDDGDGMTTTTAVPVPYSWLAAYYPSASSSSYETLAAQKGANGHYVWESYVAGLDPTDPTSVFKAVITIENGKPVVAYEPVLDAGQTALRKYTVYGLKDLVNGNWSEVSAGGESAYKFFKITVEMK